MATLHVLSHSPFADSRLDSCLVLMSVRDGLLLSGDAVYALQPGSAPHAALRTRPAGARLYALEEDVRARALSAGDDVELIDYPRFVELAGEFDRVNSWL
ncbi:sulfurtransferase complex subunit TusB [Stutzerimonas azotifigens]|uniref:sulfurtransferase complex subunit TusB n=1 Tax=Stutzerimonas azotifigens TaxID=291995 RepID=UPI00040A91B7|nr:sulfurtransferase complex subunit TusB [Stutzerimonas azotifigens]